MTNAQIERLLTPKEVALFLGVHPNTLWKWRNRGYGPVPIQIGRTYRYRRREVERFIDQSSRRFTPPDT
jgi:predicted DNA-binding transcriptional regulator AlpA